MRRWGLLVVAAVGLLAGVLVAPQKASATPFPETWLADGNFHTYCYTSTFTSDQAVGQYGMDTLDSTTDFTSSFDSSCDDGTDVWWWELNLAAGIRGEAQCMVWYSATQCHSADVRLDYAELDVGSNDWYDRRKTAVHEIGHTVGLGHHNDCAMISGEIPSTALQWRRYSAHDVEHINAAY
jgi:hypothetical protein